MPRRKVIVKGGDKYIVCPKCGAIYNSAEAEYCPGCLYGLKFDYSPKKKKLTPEQIEKKRKYNREYYHRHKKKRKTSKVCGTLEEIDYDEQFYDEQFDEILEGFEK